MVDIFIVILKKCNLFTYIYTYRRIRLRNSALKVNPETTVITKGVCERLKWLGKQKMPTTQ